MSQIMELRSKRNTLWEQTKAFLEKHRGENGLVEASAVETYNKMASDVQALGAEIERLEQQAAVDAALAAPTSKPVTNAPTATNDRKSETNPTATDEYKDAFWNMVRNKGDQFAVRNALSIGEDTEGGYTVPDEFVRL
jgi:HK97 family phage major capsid protein